MYGSVRSQLMQVYVPKSTSTTLRRRSCAVSGSELSHAVAAASDGVLPLSLMDRGHEEQLLVRLVS